MIGGEFDLSVGSTIGLCGMTLLLATTHFGWPLWAALTLAVVLAVAIGVLNGYVVVRTGLPSFLVTLATLFVARGLTIALTRRLTGRTQLGGLHDVPGVGIAHFVLGRDVIGAVRVSVVWWLLLALAAGWLLLRTRFGNWVFALGGAPAVARNTGVPVARVKILLFVGTALAACLVALMQAIRYDGTDVLRGSGEEFRAIVAAVIGGTLLSGGYGSILGAVLGALIFGMVQQGIVLTGVDADWFQVLLGALLLVAVLANHTMQARLLRAR
jgi:simple sugar transport system permease protein